MDTHTDSENGARIEWFLVTVVVFLRWEVWDQEKCLINSSFRCGVIPKLQKPKQWHMVLPPTVYLLPWVFRKIGKHSLSRFECVNKYMRTSLLCRT